MVFGGIRVSSAQIRGKICLPESLALARPVAAEELTRGNRFSAFRLQLQQLQNASTAATSNQLLGIPSQLSWRSRFALRHARRNDLQALAAKLRGRSRPRLKAAPAIVDFSCRASEVNLP